MDVFKKLAQKAKNEGKVEAEQEINTALNDLIAFETRLNAQKIAQDKKQKELEDAEEAQKKREARIRETEMNLEYKKKRLQKDIQDFKDEQYSELY